MVRGRKRGEVISDSVALSWLKLRELMAPRSFVRFSPNREIVHGPLTRPMRAWTLSIGSPGKYEGKVELGCALACWRPRFRLALQARLRSKRRSLDRLRV